MNADAITAAHRGRRAIVYIRQSTERQVIENQESQRRQRDLVERAVELGWPRDQVVQLDEDQGKSGAGTRDRSGFRQMVAEAALGGVGIIIALEVSRVSRSNHDWYHLLDICAVTGTLIADAEGLYDPRGHNDRLLLGLKATMSETELLMIRRPDFLRLIQKDPQIAIKLLSVLASRLRKTDRKIEGLALSDVTGRITQTVLQLAEEQGEPTPEGVLVRNRPTHQDLANMSGTTRETVSRVLKRLETQGYIVHRGKDLLIVGSESLTDRP